MQFIKLDAQFKGNDKLSNDGKVAYSYLYDRMQSSVKRPEFYDKKQANYYVIYTVDEMAADLCVSRNKVIDIYKKLVELGLLIKTRQYSKATKLFLPKFTDDSKSLESQPSEVKKLNSNQTNLNHTNITSNTSHTADVESENEIDTFKQALVDKSKMSITAVNQILRFTKYQIEDAKRVAGVVFKAKYVIAKQNQLLNSNVSRFESNTNLMHGLGAKLAHIFSYAVNKDNQLAYIFNSLKEYFTGAFGLANVELVTPVTESKPKSNTVQPAWLDNSDAWEEPQVSDAERAKVAEMLKQFE